MYNFKKLTLPSYFLLIFISIFNLKINASNTVSDSVISIDVINYTAVIEPDIFNRSIKGTVDIKIKFTSSCNSFQLDCGNLKIDSVTVNKSKINFHTENNKLIIHSDKYFNKNNFYVFHIVYNGIPKYGVKFYPEKKQVYTVFSTSQWMVCNDSPDDKATFNLELILPKGLNCISNGEPVYSKEINDKSIYNWVLKTPSPTYILGFAAGNFATLKDKYKNISLIYAGKDSLKNNLSKVFVTTAPAMKFFEEKSGIKYYNSSYTQVLVEGYAAQEMANFTVLGNSYANDVLEDDKEIWLSVHELSHQWWGNMVTCKNWNHFWLNEGFATFMVAAFKEYQFGHKYYLDEIDKIKAKYEKVVKAGKDKPLVFPDWNKPTSEDRTIVYYKGAYVLHLLKVELGDNLFWKCVKNYTKEYFGKTVTTIEFQKSFEKTSHKNLSSFFNKWVY